MTAPTKPSEPGAISTNLFTHEVSHVARTIGRSHEIDVVFEGSEAKTNGSKIIMPALPDDRELSSQQARAMRGYADHETFHVRKTDMEAWQHFGVTDSKAPHETWEAFANCVEDLRIERHGYADYPGAQRNIAALVEIQSAQHLDMIDKDPTLLDDEVKASAAALAYEGRRRMGTAVDACEAMLAKLPPKAVEQAKRWADATESLPDGKEGTRQSINLARMILGDLGLVDKPKSDEGEGEGEGEGHGRGRGSAGAGEGGGEGEAGCEGEGASGEAGGTGEGDSLRHGRDGEGRESSFGEGGGKGAGTGVTKHDGHFPEPDAEEFRKMLADLKKARTKTKSAGLETELGGVVEAEAKEVVGALSRENLPYLVANPQNDEWHTKTNGYFSGRLSKPSNLRSYEASVRSAASTLGVMRRKLERMILAKQRRDWDVAREVGSLDPKRLVQAAMGQRNVYRTRADRAELDTAVCILVDLSGSMSGHKAILAQQVAIALATCLNTIGADFAIYGFSNTHGKGLGRGSAKHVLDTAGNAIPWGRVEPLDMFVFKEFGETMREAKLSLGAISSTIGGNNSDADAIIEAWGKLRDRPARRKVFITLSDGEPAWRCPLADVSGKPGSYGKRTYINDLTKRAVERVIAEGGDIAGVGILDDSVKEFYPIWAVAHNLDEFAGLAMDTLARLMLGERARVSKAAA